MIFEYKYKKNHNHLVRNAKDKESLITNLTNQNIFKTCDSNTVLPIHFNKENHLHLYRWTSLVHQLAPNRFKSGKFFDTLNVDSVKKTKNKSIPNDEENKKLVEFFGKKVKKEEMAKIKNDTSFNKDNNKIPKDFLIKNSEV